MNARSNVIALPSTRDRANPGVDVTALTFDELQVIFYASGLTWRSHRNANFEELSAVVMEQVNRLGLPVVQELARQIRQAINACQWGVWESLLPGREARSDSDWLAREFRRRIAIATDPRTAARAVWQHVLDTLTSDGREVA